MKSKHWVGVAAVCGAVYLIVNGYEHGWGWLVFVALMTL